MPGLDLIDHSPHHPSPAEPLQNASNVILIDNYDSFTWNVFQYLVLEGATVTVHRNDQITLAELIAAAPTQLVVSPGPGHPQKDSGISIEAIAHFSGKIPVLGVCMGEQCIYSVFGGEVVFAGEILHGKTSAVRHDSRGIFEGLPQDLPVTRYHSLAGTHQTLPSCLEVSAWVPMGQGGAKGVIMGVRHKVFVVEGVQFHPESILTAKGRMMLKNFLHMRGGTWAENARLSKESNEAKRPAVSKGAAPVHKPAERGNPLNPQRSILDEIFDRRKATVAAQKGFPSQFPSDLKSAYDLNLAPPLVPFAERLRQSPFTLSLMAEIKRASPSKGPIAITACAPSQAKTYALAGASVISVLTEPAYFKGSLDDLKLVRRVLHGMPNRPAVLRKDFIFDEYQILEARLAGADSVLLIVKMLEDFPLTRLYHYSVSLGMEPLVEVNNAKEMKRAVALGAKVIGVNNRNLTSFEVDLKTTSSLLDLVPKNTFVCALSGISSAADLEAYKKDGVGAVLVGEALMRASDPSIFINNLFGGSQIPEPQSDAEELLVKICGTRTSTAAKAAIAAGADMIGMILVEGRRRSIPTEIALEISRTVHETPKPPRTVAAPSIRPPIAEEYFQHTSQHFFSQPSRALLVGVFQNQPLEHVLAQQKLLGLDIVQLHGSEPLEWALQIPVPVIHSFKPRDPMLGVRGYHALPLLDSAEGGSGQRLDMAEIETTLKRDAGLRVILAGGLNPDNVANAIHELGDTAKRVVAVDVSSGVEEDGIQSVEKIRAFVLAAKTAAQKPSAL